MPIATNDTLIAQRTLEPVTITRFWAGVASGASNACWEWSKAINSEGYGVFSLQKNGLNVTIGAHRFSYVSAFGPIADPAVRIVQTCRSRSCCNPAHLEAVLSYGQDKPEKGEPGERAELADAAIRGQDG